MSPQTMRINKDTMSFPRVSGDEPEMLMKKDNMRGFSPRERG